MSSVAVILANCANDEGENVYPSVGRIERETRLGASTVRRVLAAFEEAGLLEVIAEASGNKWGRSTTVRRFVVERLQDLTAVKERRENRDYFVPSTHVLKEIADGDKMRWAIVARGPDDKSDYDKFKAPTPPAAGGVPDCRPSQSGTPPSQSGRGPLPQREPPPPAAGAYPSLNLHLPVTDSLPLPPTGYAQATHRGEGEGKGSFGSSEGAATSRSVIKFTAKWDWEATQAISELVTEGHPVGAMIADWCGTLHPPKDANGAAWVATVRNLVGHHSVEVLKRLSVEVLRVQARDVPPAGKLADKADAIAKVVALEIAQAAEADRARALERAALERLAPGVEADAVPARQDALALRRVVVETLPGGAAIDQSWLTDLLVLERTGQLLQLSVGDKFKARFIASSQMHAQLVDCARQLWPQIMLVDCVTHSRKPAAPIHAASAEVSP